MFVPANYSEQGPHILREDLKHAVVLSFRGLNLSNDGESHKLEDFIRCETKTCGETNILGRNVTVVFYNCNVNMTFAEAVKMLHRSGKFQFPSTVCELVIANCTAVEEAILTNLPFRFSRLAISVDRSAYPVSETFLKCMVKTTTTTHLILTGTHFPMTKDVGYVVNEMVRQSTNLKNIYLHNCDIPGEFLEGMFASTVVGSTKGRLKSFDLTGSRLDNDAWDHVIAFFGHEGGKTPRQLYIHFTNISSDIFGKITKKLVKNEAIEELHCGGLQLVSPKAWTDFFDELATEGTKSNLKVINFDRPYNIMTGDNLVYPCNVFNDDMASSLAKAIKSLKELHTLRLGECSGITQDAWDCILQVISERKNIVCIDIGNQHFSDTAAVNFAEYMKKHNPKVDRVNFNCAGKDWGWRGVFELLENNARVRTMSFRCSSYLDDNIIKNLVTATQRNEHIKHIVFLNGVGQNQALLFKPLLDGEKISSVSFYFDDVQGNRVHFRWCSRVWLIT
ncbi:hypothetical protein ACHAW6_001148 [Cyclotella cf. meneghiniana]